MKNCISLFLIFLFLLFLTAVPVQAGQKEDYGILDVKNHAVANLPRAAGDGVTDDTATLQTLLDYAHRNRMIALFPSGTYLVSNTLKLIDDNDNQMSRYYSFLLIGSTQGSKPVIKLKDSSSGFNSKAAPKPIIYMFRICGADPDEDPTKCAGGPDNEGQGNNYFNDGLRNLKIEVGSNNQGAVGVSFHAHQDSFVEDIEIDMTRSGYAGFTSMPGMATVTGNLTITGGDYGILGSNIQNGGTTTINRIKNSTLNNIKLIDQSVLALSTGSTFVTTMVGFEIVKDSAPAIEVTSGRGISLIDGKITIRNNSSAPAIKFNGNIPSSVTNVAVKNANTLVSAGSDLVLGGTNWYTVGGFYSKDSRGGSFSILDTTSNSDAYVVGVQQLTAEPEGLGKYHTWPKIESPDVLLAQSQQPGQTRVCNALAPNDNFSILGNLSQNDQPGLQALIESNQCDTIFFPKGEYFLGNTLTIKGSTKLIGVSNTYVKFYPSTNMSAYTEWKPTSPADFVTTDNSASAAPWLVDIQLRIPTQPKEFDWLTVLHWRAGKMSLVKNVITNVSPSRESQTKPKAEIKYSGNGGGKWFGAGSKGTPAFSPNYADVNHRKFLVTGTTEPLSLYNFNIEDGSECWSYSEQNGCQPNAWQAEVRNSSNVAIFGAKFENYRTLKFEGSSNIFFAGASGSTEVGFYNNTAVLAAVLTGGRSQQHVAVVSDGSFTKELGTDDVLSVYKKGSVDLNVFRYTYSETTPPATPPPTTPPPSTPPPTPLRISDIAPQPVPDGRVNILDYTLLLQHFGETGTVGFHPADIIQNGAVDIFDYNRLLQDLGS